MASPRLVVLGLASGLTREAAVRLAREPLLAESETVTLGAIRVLAAAIGITGKVVGASPRVAARELDRLPLGIPERGVRARRAVGVS